MTTIIATRRLVATIGLVVTFGAGTSGAIWPQDMATEIKSCKAMADEKQRLRCFDRLFGVPANSQSPPEGAKDNWSIEAANWLPQARLSKTCYTRRWVLPKQTAKKP